MNLTVGPHPSAVYWRRRALVAAPLLVILITFSTCLASGSDGSSDKPKATAGQSRDDPEPTPTPSETPSHSASPSTLAPALIPTEVPSSNVPVSPPPASPEACADKDLTLVALMAEATYRIGSQPRFKLAVTNSSATPCVRDVGSGQQELWVSAGTRKLWSSDHCSPNRGADSRTLHPGEKLTYWLDWSGRTSEVGCPKTRTEVGAGTYLLTARLGTLVSKPVEFTLTK